MNMIYIFKIQPNGHLSGFFRVKNSKEKNALILFTCNILELSMEVEKRDGN